MITILIAFLLIFVSVAFLGLGKLLTGKSKLRLGMCGKFPRKKKGSETGCGKDQTCDLCGKKEEEDDDKKND